jgi:hypothetical protein
VKATSPGQDKLVETGIDLAKPRCPSGLGHVMAMVEPHPVDRAMGPAAELTRGCRPRARRVDPRRQPTTLVAMVTELADGKSAPGVKV